MRFRAGRSICWLSALRALHPVEQSIDHIFIKHTYCYRTEHIEGTIELALEISLLYHRLYIIISNYSAPELERELDSHTPQAYSGERVYNADLYMAVALRRMRSILLGTRCGSWCSRRLLFLSKCVGLWLGSRLARSQVIDCTSLSIMYILRE